MKIPGVEISRAGGGAAIPFLAAGLYHILKKVSYWLHNYEGQAQSFVDPDL